MALSLPGNPDLEHLRRAARSLQRAVRDGDARALALVAAHDPHGAPDEPRRFTLAAAQLVVARSHGFASWPRLAAHLAAAARLSRDPVVLDPVGSSHDPALLVPALACLTYTDRDEPARWARAVELLAAHPDLPRTDVAVAATVGDVAALRAHVSADRAAAVREVGPFRWAPLLYVVYSRVPQQDPVAAASLLLDAGADPDSGYLWQGLASPFTALTGVFGEGEAGPGRQPRHPRWRELAELLLDRGADPNDRQALYNRMFGRDDSHLELLLDHGLGRPASEVWGQRLTTPGETVAEMLDRQVRWARDHGLDDRLALLARHGLVPDGSPSGQPVPTIHRARTPDAVRAAATAGADLDAVHDGRTAAHQAAFLGDVALLGALLDAGADLGAVDAVHGTTPLSWARWARQDAAAAWLEAHVADVADAADAADAAEQDAGRPHGQG
ncbi:hypothetical protein GCM10023258_29420 [Terrabacter aeriphilus]|uniref:Ankyrin repeat protein n=1 Tax=Terrabacter aeriphilus TaxID=515662 RepID=A0ABP9JGL6_9MICO